MSGFDPDKYLAEKTGKGFDPDKYLAEKTGAAPAQTVPDDGGGVLTKGSASRAGAIGFAQGSTFGFADELGGLIGALSLGDGVHLTDEARRELADRGMEVPKDASAYEITRDLLRNEADVARAKHKGAFTAGQVAGGLITTPLLPGGGAATLGNAIKTGAMYGAAEGLGDSTAALNNGDVGGALWDTAKGATAGAVTGGLGHGALRIAAPVARATGNALGKVAVSMGRKVLLNGADSLSTRLKVPDDVVREALDAGAVKAFGTTEGAFGRINDAVERHGELYNAALQELEDQGVSGPKAQEIAKELLQRADKLEPNTMNEALPALFRDAAEKVQQKAGNAAELPLSQAENLKKSLQAMAKYGRFEETPQNEVKREIASVFRQANEDAVQRAAEAAPMGSDVATLGDAFVPMKQRMGRLLEAQKAVTRGVARGSQRSAGIIPGEEVAGKVMAGENPISLLAKPALALVKQRLPSTIASGANIGAKLANGTAGLMRNAALQPGVQNVAARLPGELAPGLVGGGQQPPQTLSATDQRKQKAADAFVNANGG